MIRPAWLLVLACGVALARDIGFQLEKDPKDMDAVELAANVRAFKKAFGDKPGMKAKLDALEKKLEGLGVDYEMLDDPDLGPELSPGGDFKHMPNTRLPTKEEMIQ